MLKWFFRAQRLPKITSLATLIIAAALIAMAASALAPCGLHTIVFAAEHAPDWLVAAAQEKLPEYKKDTAAVILLDEVQTTVQDNGEIYTRHRGAVRLLRPEAKEDYSDIVVPFDKETKIVSLKAWTILSNGRDMAVGEKDTIERGFLSEELYEDVKVKQLRFPEAEPGNVVGFEFVQRDRPYIFEDDWEFQQEVPVKTARLILQMPPGWEFSTSWFNHAGEKPQSQGANQYVWELNDLPAVEIEPSMPSWHVVAGWAGVKYFPRDPAMRAKTSGSWKDVGLWYDSLTQTSRIASPEIKQKVAELTSGISDPLQKMRALTEYMQRNIRYYGVEIGIGGYQPHDASEVFAHQYGDCKDKATLLSSMLHEIGIESYYVLIDSHRGVVRSNYPSIHFNHAILAIKLPDSVPSTALFAEINDPQLGRLLIFDPTNEYVPLGYIPNYLQDSYGLVVAPDGGHMLAMPLLPPATNRLLRTASFQLTPTGDLSGDVRELRWGGPAADDRRELIESEPSKRVEIFEHFLGHFLNNFTLTGASIGNLEKYSDTLMLNYKFDSLGYAKVAGDLLVFPPRVVGDKFTSMLDLFTISGKPRQFPIEFEEATRQDDVFDFALPKGYVLDGAPEPFHADCDYATYQSEMKVGDDGVLHSKRTLEIKDIVVPTEKLPELQAFLQKVAMDQSSSAVLRRATP
jgi:transglutaminase-like putative cysteine protease